MLTYLQAKLDEAMSDPRKQEIINRLMQGEAPFEGLSSAPQSTAYTLVKKLVLSGLVHHRRDPSDGRTILYQLNPLLTSTRSQDSALASSDRNAKIAP